MKQTIDVYDFRDAFMAIRPDNFSYEGLGELFEFAEQLEADTGEEMDLDVIAWCVDFTEYESLDQIRSDYGKDADEWETWDDVAEETTVIPVGDGAIVASF